MRSINPYEVGLGHQCASFVHNIRYACCSTAQGTDALEFLSTAASARDLIQLK